MREDDGGGRRRARSGGELQVLSDGSSSEVPAVWVVAGGSPREGELGGVVHGGRASPAAAQSKKSTGGEKL